MKARLTRAIATAAVLTWTAGAQSPRAQSLAIRIAATSIADLRQWDAAANRMTGTGELRLASSTADTLVAGRVHERFDQFFHGVRVLGGDLVRQTDRGLAVSVFGTVYPALSLDVTPGLSRDDAVKVIAERTGVALGGDRLPELLIAPDDSGGARLIYRAKAFTQTDGIEYWIDARTGAVLRELSAVQRQSSAIGRGAGVLGAVKKLSVSSQSGMYLASDLLRPPSLHTYDMRANLQRTLNILNGVTTPSSSDFAWSATVEWSDPVAIDAHAHAGSVYDYYYKRFGRLGLDNRNIPLLNMIHTVEQDDVLFQPNEIVGLFYLNAFYAGDGIMVYGEGLPTYITVGGQRWNYLAGGLDVAAHELTHGVTEFTSDLIYNNESGALNEAFSDIMATAIEFFYQAPGSGPLQADYLIAEDVVTPGGIRSLSNPGAFSDPDHYSRRYTGSDDNGGVHTNSMIPSHAYYLAVEGGTNRTSGLAVAGVGQANRDQMEKVFYRAFTQLMPSGATFAVARAATIQAARDLYGAGSSTERAVTQAWAAVGVN